MGGGTYYCNEGQKVQNRPCHNYQQEMSTVMSQTRPPLRIAVLLTVWFEESHADVVVPRLVDGWTLDGVAQSADLDVAAVYLEQVGSFEGEDIGLRFLEDRGILRAETIGAALGAGAPGVNVDGVVIIGEHGAYELNEYGQQLYPRRRFFDAAIAAMTAAGRFVPVFNDKGISYSSRDANEMVAVSKRLGFGFGAGSTVPIAWRIPQGAQWPAGQQMEVAVLLGWGPLERYGFHCLEGLQAHTERRAGGEHGVTSVAALSPARSREALSDGTVPADLLDRAMDQLELSAIERAGALESVAGVIDIRYGDGLRAFVVICENVVRQFALALRGPETDFACQMWLQEAPNTHFGFLVRQIEHLVHTGRPQIPIERTQLTTGILDAAMRSWGGEVALDTPELAISYAAPLDVNGTGIDLPLPAGWTRIG